MIKLIPTKKKAITLQMNRRGDWISEVKTKSGALVTRRLRRSEKQRRRRRSEKSSLSVHSPSSFSFLFSFWSVRSLFLPFVCIYLFHRMSFVSISSTAWTVTSFFFFIYFCIHRLDWIKKKRIKEIKRKKRGHSNKLKQKQRGAIILAREEDVSRILEFAEWNLHIVPHHRSLVYAPYPFGLKYI